MGVNKMMNTSHKAQQVFDATGVPHPVGPVKVSCNDSMDFGRYIQNFEHQGFEPESCVHELVGNSIDSKSDNIKLICQKTGNKTELRYVDNGKGMSRKDVLEKYCPFHGENHKTDSSIGTQGVGGKKSAYLLSRKTGQCRIVTTNNGSNYTTLIMDWKEAKLTKDLGNLYTIMDSNSDEIAQFVEDRGGDRNICGLTLIMPYNLDVYQMLQKLITKPQDIDETDHRLDIAFGEFGIEFSFVNKENETHNSSLTNGYNYFDNEEGPLDFEIVGDDESGIVRCPLEVYQNKRNKNLYAYPFEYGGQQWSVPEKAGRGKGNTPKVDRNNYDKDSTWEKVSREGQIVIEVAFRKNDDFFKNDSLHGPNSAAQCQSNYDKNYFKKPNNDFLSAIKINRNGHALAPIGQPKVLNTSRSNLEGRALLLTQIVLRVNTTGSQDDKLVDNLIKMSQNKGAMREHNCLPHKLMCSITWLRTQHRDKVLTKMNKVASNNMNIKIKADEKKRKAAEAARAEAALAEAARAEAAAAEAAPAEAEAAPAEAEAAPAEAEAAPAEVSETVFEQLAAAAKTPVPTPAPTGGGGESKSRDDDDYDDDDDDDAFEKAKKEAEKLEDYDAFLHKVVIDCQHQKQIYPLVTEKINSFINMIKKEREQNREALSIAIQNYAENYASPPSF